jgi:hypothetical protein
MAAERLTNNVVLWIATAARRPDASAAMAYLRPVDPPMADCFISLVHLLQSQPQSSVSACPPPTRSGGSDGRG